MIDFVFVVSSTFFLFLGFLRGSNEMTRLICVPRRNQRSGRDMGDFA